MNKGWPENKTPKSSRPLSRALVSALKAVFASPGEGAQWEGGRLREDGDQGREGEDRLEGEQHVRDQTADRHLVGENHVAAVPHGDEDARVAGEVGHRGQSTCKPHTKQARRRPELRLKKIYNKQL